jgi:sulfite exporter TauE/SafE
MLGSLNPLVQRVRNGKWWVTTTAYVVSSTVGGTVIGAVLGALGGQMRATRQPSPLVALAVLAALGLSGAVFDLEAFRLRLPTVVRQVDEAWRYRYRNWVYATGYGLQLGLGITTIVTTAAVYTTLITAFLVGSWPLGAAIGAWFGFARSVSVLTVGRVQSSSQFDAIESELKRWNRRSKLATVFGQAVVGVALAGVATL